MLLHPFHISITILIERRSSKTKPLGRSRSLNVTDGINLDSHHLIFATTLVIKF